jgi:hypothetical protein
MIFAELRLTSSIVPRLSQARAGSLFDTRPVPQHLLAMTGLSIIG